jgi:site-specific DNA-methyltransferase (adenine-specific)
VDHGVVPDEEIHIGEHRLIHRNCLAVLPGLSAESVDVTVTSPPYNLGVAYRRYQDSRVEEDYLDWLLRVAAELRWVMPPEASYFLNISGSAKSP